MILKCIYDILNCIPMFYNKYCKITVRLVTMGEKTIVLQSDRTMIPLQFFFIMGQNFIVVSWILVYFNAPYCYYQKGTMVFRTCSM